MSTFGALRELASPIAARGWRIEGYVRAIAGTFVLTSVALGIAVNHWWLLLAVFVGLNLIQSAFTGWCLMSNLLSVASRGGRSGK